MQDLRMIAYQRKMVTDCYSRKRCLILPGLFETEKLEILLCTVRNENTSTTMAGKMLQQNQEHGSRRVLVEASRQ